MSDMEPIGNTARAYIATAIADSSRAQQYGSPIQVSAAEVDLAAALMRADVGDWTQQEQIGPYYVDFLFDRSFVVEVDGAAYHDNPLRERARDRYLLRAGIRRIWHIAALEVLLDAPGVVNKIVEERAQLRASMEPGLPAARIRPRPVMSRAVDRWMGRPLNAPTDEEKADAILVLRDGPETEHPVADPLYAEAERIFAEGAS